MDRYLFDKRVMKKLFLKYGLILGFVFILLIFVNMLLPGLDGAALIAVDLLITFIVVLSVEFVLKKIKARKMEKEEENIKFI